MPSYNAQVISPHGILDGHIRKSLFPKLKPVIVTSHTRSHPMAGRGISCIGGSVPQSEAEI